MGLWDAVTNLPGGIASAVINSFSGLLVGFVQPMLDFAKALITTNINPFDFQNFWQIIVTIISCFYLLLFLIVGLKFLFGSYDAVQRKEAKEWLKKAVLLVIAVNASLLLYALLLSLSSGIALTLWSNQFDSLFIIQNLNALDLIWLAIFAFSLFSVVVTLVVRQIFLILGVMLFPIGLFLYFIPPVKEYGSMILNLIGVMAFMNVLDVIVLIAVQLFWNEFNTLNLINLLAPSLGFMFLGFANIAIMWFAIQKALNSVGIKVDVVGTVKSIAGPALMAALA